MATNVNNGNVCWEVRPTNGNDNNGGGFLLGSGTNTTATDLTIDASNNKKVTSASIGAFGSTHVGMYLLVTAGTGWQPGFYQIASVSSGAAILDMSPSAAGNANTANVTFYNVSIDFSRNNGAAASESATGGGASTNTMTPSASATGANGWTAVTTADIGNVVHITAGTNAVAGFYIITAVSAGALGIGTWTLSGSANAFSGSTTNVTYKMGGALGTLAFTSGMVLSNKFFFKQESGLSRSATMTLTTSDSSALASHALPPTILSGYATARNDGVTSSNWPTITATSNGVNCLTYNPNNSIVQYFNFNGGSFTTTVGLNLNGSTSIGRAIKATNCLQCGIHGNANNGIIIEFCEVTGSSGSGFSAFGNQAISIQIGMVQNCYVHDNSTSGILVVGGNLQINAIHKNLVVNSTSANGYGIVVATSVPSFIVNNTVDRCGGDCINTTNTDNAGIHWIKGNILSNWGLTTNPSYGMKLFTTAGKAAQSNFDGNAYYNGQSIGANRLNCDDLNTEIINALVPLSSYYATQDITLTANPYTTANSDWTLNNDAGGGAAVRATCPGNTFNGTSLVGYSDYGCFRHADPAGGGAPGRRDMRGGFIN